MVLSILIIAFTLYYAVFVLRSYFGLFRIEKPKTRRQFFVSIVVPARNEERKIGKCLDTLVAQDYTKDKYEIIVVNDGSTDRTEEIVEAYQRRQTEVRLILITIDNCLARTTAYKKFSISRGIDVSKGDIILTTDADSVQPGGWIQEMVNHFEEDVGFVSGPVTYTNEKTLFHKLQSLEFLGLVTTGAGAIGSGHPIICNGANVAYRKEVFYEVGGFFGIDGVASGDDELLMQKIAQRKKWKVAFSLSQETVVKTEPLDTVRQFLNQRKRWASKGLHYHSRVLVLILVSLYLYFLLLFIGLPLTVLSLGSSLNSMLLAATFFPSLCIKLILDYLIARQGCHLFRRKELLMYFLLAELLHVPYIAYAGLAGLVGRFEWKGRRIQR